MGLRSGSKIDASSSAPWPSHCLSAISTAMFTTTNCIHFIHFETGR